MKRVVVTGASGFLGRAVVAALWRAGADVVPVARRPVDGAVVVTEYGAETPEGDVLVHLADTRDRAAAAEAGEAHVRAATGTLRALLAKGFRKTVYASSAVVYEDTAPPARRVGDPTPTDDPYARGKRACEAEVVAAGGAVARLSNLYGPGMAAGNVMSTILKQIPAAGPLTVWDVSPVRDFLWVDDAAEAVAALAMGPETGVFNVGSGRATSVEDLARTALAVAGQADRAVVASRPGGRDSFLVLDIGDTCRRLNWAPRTSLIEGLGRLMLREGRNQA